MGIFNSRVTVERQHGREFCHFAFILRGYPHQFPVPIL